MFNTMSSFSSAFSSAMGNSSNVARKSGNPYFTGSSGGAGSGSFLFRSPNQESGSNNKDGGRNFYETKVDVQVNPVTKTVSKSVRYVPKPNELRELNFWSPTSM